MKKAIIILFVLFAGCTSSYDKANEAVENIKTAQSSIDGLMQKADYKKAVQVAAADSRMGMVITDAPTANWYGSDYINYLKNSGDTLTANCLKEISLHQLRISANKIIFEQEIINVSDAAKQLSLLQKFDRVYVLRIKK